MVWLTVGCGALLFVVSAVLQPVRWDADRLTLTVILALMTTAARIYPVRVSGAMNFVVDSAPSFAAALLLPPPLAMATVAASVLIGRIVRRARWYAALFTAAECAIKVGIGALLFQGINGGQLVDLTAGAWMIAVPVTAVAMHLVNTVLVHGMICVQRRRFSLWEYGNHMRGDLQQQASMYLLGLLVAALGAEHAWTMALLAVPTVVAHRSLRDGLALRFQTRAALEGLVDALDRRDHYTCEHSRRVGVLARLTAETLRLKPDQVAVIETAARLHDVGKIGIKSSVLMKPAGLSDHEWREMRTHPEVGAALLGQFPQFAMGRELVLAHHERWDGGGYPRGLRGEAIPLGARIIAVCDTWDAMSSHRAYRRALPIEVAYAEMERVRGTQFDPAVLDAFFTVLQKHPDLAQTQTQITQDVDLPAARHRVA